MRQALSVWFFVIALLGCPAIPDGNLDDVDDPLDFDGSGHPRREPVDAIHYLSSPLPRPLDYDRPLSLCTPPCPYTKWPNPRMLLARLWAGSSSRWMPRRTPRPRWSGSATWTPLALCDPARAV